MAAFWDTSGIILVCVPGQRVSAASRLLGQEPGVVWWATRVEVRSVLERLRKERALSPRAYDASGKRLHALLGSWREILPTDPLRELRLVEAARQVGFNVQVV